MSIPDASVNLANKGLVLIQGDNQCVDSMDSNGAGKSTLFSEALSWVLFGKTIRGLKSDEVVRRGHKDTKVSQQIVDDDGTNYTVIRYRKHKEYKNQVILLKEGKEITAKSDKDTDKLIENLIDMDYITFTNSVLFGQGISKMFAEATDGEQKKILERMLQIDIFRRCGDKAKDHISRLEKDKLQVQNNINTTQKEIFTLENTLKDLQEKEAELQTQVGARIQELKSLRSEYEEQLSKIDNSQLEKQISELEIELVTIYEQMQGYVEYGEQLALVRASIYQSEKVIKTLMESANKREQELILIKDGKNVPSVCDKCGQEIPKEDTVAIENHMQQEIDEIIDKIAEEQFNIQSEQELGGLLTEKLKEVEPLKVKDSECREAITTLQTNVRLNNNNVLNIRRSMDSTDKAIAEQEKLLGEVYTDLIESTIHKIGELKSSLSTLEIGLSDLDSQVNRYKFWQDAFGNQGIKSLLLDEVTPFLNERVEKYIGLLTDSTISVKFSTQTELKSKEVREKFSVQAINQYGDDNYQGNSGGEKRRVDVAISLALQDLVATRSNKQINFCLYDEAFDGLDAIGCEKIIELLKEKQLEKDSIFVITHNDSLSGHFDNTITVVKTKEGVSVEE